MKIALLQITLLALLLLAGCKQRGADYDILTYRPSLAEVASVRLKIEPPPLTPVEQASLAKQASAGDAEAAFRLYEYFSEEYVADGESAMKWLRTAAENGHTIAQYNYAIHLQDSERPEDWPEAIKWYERGAKSGHVDSMSALADVYESGKGTPVMLSKALAWYEAAAMRGETRSMRMMIEFLYEGKGCQRDSVSAYAWASLCESRFRKGTVAQGIVRKKREDIQKSLTPVELKAGREKLSALQEKVPINLE